METTIGGIWGFLRRSFGEKSITPARHPACRLTNPAVTVNKPD